MIKLTVAEGLAALDRRNQQEGTPGRRAVGLIERPDFDVRLYAPIGADYPQTPHVRDELYVIASGHAGFDLAGGFASNGYGEHSPGRYSLLACLTTEIVMTFAFLFVILGSTHGSAPKGFAPIAIGLCLTLIHLISIPVTNTSVNPARSTGPALFVGGWALSQLWLFWVAPIVGAALAGVVYKWVGGDEPGPVPVTGNR